MVHSINEIGRLTGRQTIAEWAENAEIIEAPRGHGVDYSQGYGVSQPQKVQRAAIAWQRYVRINWPELRIPCTRLAVRRLDCLRRRGLGGFRRARRISSASRSALDQLQRGGDPVHI